MKRVCIQCGKDFYLNNNEIRYFKQRKLALPKRCKECRELNKAKKSAPVQKKMGLLEKIFSFFKK